MKGVAAGEVLLVVAVLSLAYLLYLQQNQIAELEIEIDRLAGSTRDLAMTITNLPRPAQRSRAPKAKAKGAE